ncbi:MAG: 1-deoxy-D-xylulose-5-phosphate synthase [Armatimonadetes bacterium]|nr:1-deoxy-D-xylulose-5-phosphate synthase [Armatimonadota bacterium]
MEDILSRIDSPQDLRQLSLPQMKQLAGEIRHLLVQVLARNGGHLAPNLGTVELTLALHANFDSPKDRIVWDVGHQAYVHKILTGRRDRLPTIRQEGGLSGYCRLVESEHDAFGAGHGCTSISAALGYAVARDHRGTDEHVIAVIGDGSLTGGMAWEALSNAGHLGTNLLIVLNDNEMSISPNVGAIPNYLDKIRTDRTYLRAKEEFEGLMNHLPLGKNMVEAVERFKTGIKQLVTPGMLFEELGLTYLGPVDGHNLDVMMDAVEGAKGIKGPVLLHVVTKKGKGYGPAEADSITFHGCSPFDSETGEFVKKDGPPTYSKVFTNTLIDLAKADEKIVAITAAMLEGTGLVAFQKVLPKQIYDVGMTEQHAATFAAGLAAGGMRPVVAIYSTFLQRSYDQIVHDVCIQNLPVVFAMDRAGLVGDDGPTHNGVFDIAYLRCLPNMVAGAPKDEDELRGMLATAVEHPGPIAIRFPRGAGVGVSLDGPIQKLPVGKAEVLREGEDLLILAYGSMVKPAMDAAEKLHERGIEAAVVNTRWVKPLDLETILPLAREAKAILTVEEHQIMGGFGSAVAEALAAAEVVKPLRILGIPDQFVEHATPKAQLAWFGLNAEGITQAATEICVPTEDYRVTALLGG